MNLDEIEDLIRRYLSAGITVVIILVAPATGGTDEELTPAGEPSVVTIDPQRPDPADTSAEEDDGIAEPEPSSGSPDPDAPDLDPRDPADDPADDAADGPTADDPDSDDPNSDDTGGDDTGGDDAEPGDAEPGDAAAEDADADADDDREAGPADHADEVADEPAGDRDPGDPPAAHEPSTSDEPQQSADDDGSEEGRSEEDPDAVTPSDGDDPDLADRGPADGSEPGIDDEPDAPSTGPDPTDDEGTDTREALDSAASDAGSEGSTAAERFGWGTPDREDDFDSGLAQWDLYDGPGHAGAGVRSPDAVTLRDGILTITGDAQGTTGGMAWGTGQRYGRWEGRVRAPESDPSYNALLLLWPDADDFPEGGEIDFMEMLDPTRQSTEFFLHHGPDNEQVTAQVEIDGTQWHNWAVEWTPDEIVGYVDGEEWFRTTDTSTFPPGPMHLCIQLDWFPDGAGEVRESSMEVDWVRQYALEPADVGPADEQDDRDVASTEPASVAEPATDDDPLRRMFSWS